MKTFSSKFPLLGLGLLLSLPLATQSAEDATVTVPAPAPLAPPAQVSVSATPNPTKPPNAVAEVVKLTKAQVSEDIIISYVQNSTSTTRLSPDDIVRLRNEGVSDRVIYAMMDKNGKAVAVATANTANPAPPAPVYQDVPPSADVQAQAPQQPATAPLTPSGSSTYVIPYPAASSAYYGYYGAPYPYPYPYYYGGPVISFGFGYGGHYHYGGHYGGGIHVHGHH